MHSGAEHATGKDDDRALSTANELELETLSLSEVAVASEASGKQRLDLGPCRVRTCFYLSWRILE